MVGLLFLLLPTILLSLPAQASTESQVFGPNEKIVSAYQAGDLSVDDMVTYGVASLTAPETVPEELRPTGPLSTDPQTYLTYLSAMSGKASESARKVLSPPAQASHATTDTAKTNTVSTNAANTNYDCARDEPFEYMTKDFYCWANVDGFVIFYNVVGGVPPTPAEPSGRPTVIQHMVEAVSIAAKTYRAMGYTITSNPAVPHGIFVGLDKITYPRGEWKVKAPFVMPIGYNFLPTILIPSDSKDFVSEGYDYHARHELFHVFQYSYWPAGQVGVELIWDFFASDKFGSMNWWMEATAEWATHMTYVKYPAHVPDPTQKIRYARNIGEFLSRPRDALNAWDGWGESRQYGAFLLPLYLTEQIGPDFVRHTWEHIRSAKSAPITAIKASLNGRDLNMLLHTFAIANYRLASPQPLMEAMGYRDPDVDMWRSILAKENATDEDMLGGARPARLPQAASVGYDTFLGPQLQPGGSFYIDLAAEKGAPPTTLTVQGYTVLPGKPVPGITWSVLVWSRAGEGSSALPEYPQAHNRWGHTQREVKIEDFRYPMVATMIATRHDLRVSSAAAMLDYGSAFWWVGNYVPVQNRTCDLRKPSIGPLELNAAPADTFNDYAFTTPDGWTGGDSTYSMRMPDGRTLWLFSDTFLGPLINGTRPTSAKLINNSFVIQDGTKLTTVHGGTAEEPKALLPPPDSTHWYWSGDGFIVGNTLQVVFQKYRREGTGPMPFAFDENVVATFSLSDLTKPTNITKLPSGAGVAWGSAILPASRSGDGYTYIYGVSDAPINKQMRVARVKGNDLRVGRWQYLNLWGWTEVENNAGYIMTGIANEYSVTPWKGQFLLLSQDSTEAFSGQINAFTSCDPFDGFTNKTSVYRMPEPGPLGSYLDPDIISYNPHVHYEQSTEESLLISYNVNSMDNRVHPDADLYRDSRIYRPRFFRATIS
ncbi:hypothetical protein [Nonomuraea sp. NPDC046570]|uniref:hypothetical protein n=1 Tax=Nonomuraea sp. NPDC046570 TaxID=3155255 RepID=UPI00340D3987